MTADQQTPGCESPTVTMGTTTKEKAIMRTSTAVPQEYRHTTARWNALSKPGATVEIRTIEIPLSEAQVGDLVCACNGRPHYWITKIGESLSEGSGFGTQTDIWWEMTYCSASANGHVERDYPGSIWGDGPITVVDTIG